MTDEPQSFWEALGGKTWGEIGATTDDKFFEDPLVQLVNEMKAELETLKARVSELEAKSE